MSSPAPAIDPALVERAARLVARAGADLPPASGTARAPRVLLGLVGAPGSGKSTLSEGLLAALSDPSRGAPAVRGVVVGMDGFHIAARALTAMGLIEIKGAPETFDVAGYLALLRRLRDPGEGRVWAPEFRREIEDAVQSSIPVDADVPLVITEGNYLLADGPWAPVRELLDEVWFVDVPDEVRRRRLAARHERYGRTPEQAWERTLGSDERNARLVIGTRVRADLVVEEPGDRVGRSS